MNESSKLSLFLKSIPKEGVPFCSGNDSTLKIPVSLCCYRFDLYDAFACLPDMLGLLLQLVSHEIAQDCDVLPKHHIVYQMQSHLSCWWGDTRRANCLQSCSPIWIVNAALFYQTHTESTLALIVWRQISSGPYLLQPALQAIGFNTAQ